MQICNISYIFFLYSDHTECSEGSRRMRSMTEFTIKRVYDDPCEQDGWRVLIDRLWPRGLSKKDAKLDEWRKELAPSDELRTWFNHDNKKYHQFASRYGQELRNNPALTQAIDEWSKHPRVTLLFGARDTEHNEVTVLIEYLKK